MCSAYNNGMNKMLIMIGVALGSTLGASLPQLWGDTDRFSVASIIWGMVGGFVGIWASVKLAKYLS